MTRAAITTINPISHSITVSLQVYLRKNRDLYNQRSIITFVRLLFYLKNNKFPPIFIKKSKTLLEISSRIIKLSIAKKKLTKPAA